VNRADGSLRDLGAEAVDRGAVREIDVMDCAQQRRIIGNSRCGAAETIAEQRKH